MTEHLESDSIATPTQESDVIALLKKLQQQMLFLEKKLDLLITKQEEADASDKANGAGRPFERDHDHGSREHGSFKDRHFSKPPYRPNGPRNYSQDRPSYGGGRPPRREGQGGGGFRPYRRNGEGGHGGYSGRPDGGHSHTGFKKPFNRNRKDRG